MPPTFECVHARDTKAASVLNSLDIIVYLYWDRNLKEPGQFNHQIFIKFVLCARFCFRYWGNNSDRSRLKLLPSGSSFIYWYFLKPHLWHMEVTRLGVKLELQLQAFTTAQQCQIWAAAVIYTVACGNTRSLTCWARPGVEPASLWILVGFFFFASSSHTLDIWRFSG